MPIQYGQYQLSNSRQVKPFAGSVVPELMSVAGTLQGRYEKALDQEDLLARAVTSSQAAPFEKDQQLLMQMKQEYKNKIKQRAQQGDYENMLRNTMMDARNFVEQYKPIADNAKRYQDYKASLTTAVEKGDIKSADKARRLALLSEQSYQGMNYDPVTGQYSNQFSGITPVKDIDPTEKVDKWMKDVAPTVLGTETKYSDGQWLHYKEGKWTTLTPQEIQRVVTAGQRLDPEFNAWMQQEKQLAGVDYGKISPAAVNQMDDGPVKAAILQGMQQGMSPGAAIQSIMAANREGDIYKNMLQYANKYVRDDKIIGSGITSADPYNLQRTGKKLEDEQLVLSMPILQPETRAEVTGAEDLIGKIRQSGIAVQAARKNFDDWVSMNKLRPRGSQWVDEKGNDKTLKYLEQKQVYEQAQHGLQNLRQLEAEARKRTGYDPGKNITPALMKQADQYAAAQAERTNGLLSESSGGFKSMSEADMAKTKAQYKTEFLRTHAPGYQQYDQMLKDMTAQGAQLINVQNFNTKSANEQATTLFKNLVLNLDASGLKAGTQGLKWATGDKAGQDLEADDYKEVAADAHFAGYGMDTDGQLKYYYKVGSVKQNPKGALVGSEALVKMPALPGTTEMLLKTKQTDLAQLGLGQTINQAINTPAGQGYINVDGKNQIFVDRIDKTEIGKSEVGSGINLRFPTPGGQYTEVRANSVGEAINIITHALQKRAAREGTK